MRAKSVILLQVFLKFDPELCEREIRNLRRRLGESHKPVMNAKHHIGFILTTTETPTQLVERLRPVLDVGCIENYSALIPMRNVATKFGGIDTLPSRIAIAYAAIKRGDSQNLPKRDIFVKQRRRKRAPGQMGVKRGGDRHSAKKPDRPKG